MRQTIGFILLVIGFLSNLFLEIHGSLAHPVYNRTAAFLAAMQEYPILAGIGITCFIVGAILITLDNH